MGMSFSIYVGPMAVCKITKVLHVCEVRTCSNADCKRHKKELLSNFCPSCGTAVSRSSFTVEANPNFQEMDKELDEALWEISRESSLKDQACYVPNKKREGEPKRSTVFYTDTSAQFVTDLPVAEETAWFASSFDTELKILAKAYGSENVEIKWGIFPLYS